MKALTNEQQQKLIELHNTGWSFKALANYFNISKTSVFFYYHGGRGKDGELHNDMQGAASKLVTGGTT